MSRYMFSRRAVVGRTLLAVVGAYFLALSFSAGGATLLGRFFGMARGEAFVLTAMLAFPVWVLAVLVAFAAATGWRAGAWIMGGTAFWTVLGWALGPLPASGGL